MIESSGDAVVGQPHNLTCTVECGSANYTSLTWEDSSGTRKTTDGTESRLELHFPMLSLSNLNNTYTCKVNYDNGDSTELTKRIVAEGKC